MYNIIIKILLFILTIAFLIFLFIKFAPVFWWKPDEISMKKILNSPNFKKGEFINIVTTNVMIQRDSDEKNDFSLMWFLFPHEWKNPWKKIPNKKLEKLENNTFSWLGHSTILMNLDNKIIITDPVFNRASPIFLWWKPFEYENKIDIEDLPKLDIVLITHDHYDHLDYKTLKTLWNSVGKYIVPLWVKAHLQKWWIDSNRIEEIDWYEDIKIDSINFTLTPSRHFSWRNINNRNSTLWWWYIIKSKDLNTFISWDGWYFDEFKKIWEKYWPFDLAFLENWAYNKAWSQIHMLPEESVQAWVDLKAKTLFPIHRWKFDLSVHNWTEPIERFSKETKNKNIPIITTIIWDNFSPTKYNNVEWWNNLE